MLSTNTVYLPCRRLYQVDGSVLALSDDGAVREFMLPRQASLAWAMVGSRHGLPQELYVSATLLCAPSFTVFGLWTHCAINGQDGSQVWYAFTSWEQLRLFRLLLTADGMGPKTAFTFLDKNPWDEVFAILTRGDQAAFRKLKGMGPKTADKVIPKLFTGPAEPAKPELTPSMEDAIGVLETLGWKHGDAKKVVLACPLHGASAEDIVKAVLKGKIK